MWNGMNTNIFYTRLHDNLYFLINPAVPKHINTFGLPTMIMVAVEVDFYNRAAPMVKNFRERIF